MRYKMARFCKHPSEEIQHCDLSRGFVEKVNILAKSTIVALVQNTFHADKRNQKLIINKHNIINCSFLDINR